MKMARIGDFGDTKKPWEVEGVKWREVRLKDLVTVTLLFNPYSSLLHQKLACL
ncbi:MAG: hypothetical protein N2V76_07635 [Methanophagales archaeon]|nr:hypothetical protein [Methanophagales archaeon]